MRQTVSVDDYIVTYKNNQTFELNYKYWHSHQSHNFEEDVSKADFWLSEHSAFNPFLFLFDYYFSQFSILKA